MEPASSIIKKLGGEAVVAKVTGMAYTAPYRWQHPREKRGTGGAIPAKHIPALMAYAREQGIGLDLSEFFARPSPSSEGAAA